MMDIETPQEAAKTALNAGLSTIPPRMDGTKAPIGEWKQYQESTPSIEDIERWYDNGQTGVGLVTGAVSGNLECLDFDTHDIWEQYKARSKECGLWELVKRIAFGYIEKTPNGFHLLYKCESIGGNTKLAKETDEPLPNGVKTLIETRGQGGFIIVAPSNGRVNPDGDYVLKAGGFNTIVTISTDEREQLHSLAKTFDEMPRQDEAGFVGVTSKGSENYNNRPGDEFIRTTTWEKILEPHGWTKVFNSGGTTHWRRPDKKIGVSGTTNHNDSDLLYVFSTSTIFDAERGYNKFSAHTLLNHGGDFKKAAKTLGGTYQLSAPNNEIATEQWPTITPLNTSLPPVEPFNYKLLPDGLTAWVEDIVERTQCPPDFVGVTVMVALASLIGRKVAIHPKQHDDWLVTPNLWGVIIGRPSAMKSPAMAEGLRPLKRLAVAASQLHKEEVKGYQVEKVFKKQQDTILEQDIKTALKSGETEKIDAARNDAIAAVNDSQREPTEKRYIVNDATVEKLGELLNQNSNGLLLERDELTGWLKNLDREDKANDRSFYLECFNGGGNYTYDRIGRGTLHIESTTVSLIGCLQPSRLRPYVWHAINQGTGDDGLIQRFQLAVYPDDTGKWINIDKWPNRNSKQDAFDIFQRLDDLEPLPRDDEGRVQGVRFDEDGQKLFNEWRNELEQKIREPGIHPAVESHLTKYRSLMPSLALIINEVEQGHCLSVTEQSARKAAAWCQYLESHAMRIYGGAIDPTAQGAATILERKGKLHDGFTRRSVHRKNWAGLSEVAHVKAALNELVECGYLRTVESQIIETGGRPSTSYFWNPAA